MAIIENMNAQVIVTYGLDIAIEPIALFPLSRNMIANAAPKAAALDSPSV